MEAITQFRVMSGVIDLGAVATNVPNVYVRSHLSGTVTPPLVTRLLQSTEEIETLDPASQTVVKTIFGNGYSYNLQMKAIHDRILQLLGVPRRSWNGAAVLKIKDDCGSGDI